MEKLSLRALADGLLSHALSASSRHSTRTVHGGPPHLLSQTVTALACGQKLDDHDNQSEVTVQVLRGRVRVTAGDDTTDGSAGQLLMVPDARHTVTALEDAVLLLTVANRAPPREADPGDTGHCRLRSAPARAPMSARGCTADQATTTFDRETSP